MNARHALDADNPRLPLYPIRVLRLEANQSCFIRLLSKFYRGMRTHYVKKRSEYCPNDPEKCQFHKMPVVYKGYAACERYNETAEHWEATVLELTESLELDMRDVYQRGQVWEISRGPKKKDSQPPYVGRLHETLDAAGLPDNFDYLPCLLNLYHVTALDLTFKNPLPPRVFVKPTKGAPPSGIAKPPEVPLTLEQRQEIAKAGGLRGLVARAAEKQNGSTVKLY